MLKTKLLALTIVGILSCALLTACTSNEIAILEDIVSIAESLLPIVPTLAPADGPAVAAYVGSALSVTDDLLSNPNSAGAAKAIGDFNRLALPQLTASTSPQTQQTLNQLAGAIQKFIATYKAANIATIQISGAHAFVEPAKTKAFKISTKDRKRAEALRKRIRKAKENLKK